MKRDLQHLMAITLMLFCASTGVFGQGSTSSSMSGRVASTTETLPGATVMAVHTPSGTTYGTATNAEGRFNLVNMRVGGPYEVTVSFIGYQQKRFQEIFLTLGQSYVLNVELAEGVDLQAVDVSAYSNDQLNSDRTGASTRIDNEKITAMPTISRSFNDFTRLTPQASIKGDAISIAGVNNRYNQITIDGAVSNDVFGLNSAGTNGASTGTSPISLDAIEEFTVQIAPYDVRLGGFAGGGVSAVTRSGTNKVQGSAYYYTRNENFSGLTPGSLVDDADPDFERIRYPEFSDRQFGARVGGALVKDKLFYFLSAERTESSTPLANRPGTSESFITIQELEDVAARARAFGYDPGGYLDQEETNESIKLFARLDYNISAKHKLSMRHAYTRGEALQLSRSPNQVVFTNGGVLRESTTNSTILDFSSRFSSELSNNLIVGFTTVREPRGGAGDPFPRVRINLDAQRNIQLGTEAFSTVNELNQDIFTLTDNLSLYKGKHTLTFGTHNEFYSIYNAFIGEAFGNYQFRSIEDWEDGLATNFVHQYSRTDNPREGAEFRAMQLGLYAQDEFQITDRFKLTTGIRMDVPMYLDKPLENEDFNDSSIGESLTGQKNNDLPEPAFMFSPRVGFNWDVTGDRTTQLRGGTGIFTSRFPFVWIGGAFTQSGVLLDINRDVVPAGEPADIEFVADPNNQPRRDADAFSPGGRMTVVDQKFKLPQLWRTNVAVDQVLGSGFIGTVELMYSKNLNAFRFDNINLVDPTGRLNGADNRLLYPADRRVEGAYQESVFITNENAGESFNATFQLSKTFDMGLFASLAYSYTTSTDLFPGTSSQNHSNYYRVASVDGSNNAEVANSPFDIRSRIVGILAYEKEYLRAAKTRVSIFYNGQSGSPFSYIVNGDLNRSTFSGSASDHYSLIYVPNNQSEIIFVQNGDVTPEAQWEAFNAYISQDDYLSERRGQYAERNGARTPFTHQFDLKIMQDLFVNIGENRNTLQLSLDIFNVGNLLNQDWGRQYTYGNGYFDNTYQILRFEGLTENNEAQYTFNPVRNNEAFFTSDSPIGGSRWVAQIGFRYIFN